MNDNERKGEGRGDGRDGVGREGVSVAAQVDLGKSGGLEIT